MREQLCIVHYLDNETNLQVNMLVPFALPDYFGFLRKEWISKGPTISTGSIPHSWYLSIVRQYI